MQSVMEIFQPLANENVELHMVYCSTRYVVAQLVQALYYKVEGHWLHSWWS